MSEDSKIWKCPAGHALGQVVRNSSGVRRLLLYREAVDVTSERPEEVDVIVVIEGYAADARCSICGRVRSWFLAPEAKRR